MESYKKWSKSYVKVLSFGTMSSAGTYAYAAIVSAYERIMKALSNLEPMGRRMARMKKD